MVSIFLSVFIGIINYEQHFFLLYLIQFYTDFLSQIRHLQIEVGGGGGRMISTLGVIWNKKQKRLLFSILVASSRTRIKHFY